jgi:hypothetical protein
MRVRETPRSRQRYFNKNESNDPNRRRPGEYLAENVFWVAAQARWIELQYNAKQPTIGKLIDDAMDLIRRETPRSKVSFQTTPAPIGTRTGSASFRLDRHHCRG